MKDTQDSYELRNRRLEAEKHPEVSSQSPPFTRKNPRNIANHDFYDIRKLASSLHLFPDGAFVSQQLEHLLAKVRRDNVRPTGLSVRANETYMECVFV